jgi:hypothetical protein
MLILVRGLRHPKKWVRSAVVIALVGVFGFGLLQRVAAQKSAITIFSDETTKLAANQYYTSFQGIPQKLFGSKWIYFTQQIAGKYVASFSPEFLVVRGGRHPWHQLPGFAHLTGVSYVLALGGIGFTIVSVVQRLRKKKWPKKELLMLGTLFLAPLPAAITVDAPHATRSLLFFIILTLFAVEGARMLWVLSKSSAVLGPVLRLSLLVLAGVCTWQTGAYLQAYFQKYPAQSALILQSGYAREVQQAAGSSPGVSVAVVDPDGFQYIATAWDLRMPPEAFFATIDRHLPDRIGFQYGYRVGQFRFVVSPNDRFPEEKQRIEWDERMQRWRTQKF